MSSHRNKLSALVLIILLSVLISCNQSKTKTLTSNGYSYETVDGDPLKTRIYTLKNGLKVYLTANKNEPRVQTNIAVRTGSKNDPSDATGLAHYLEHMLFKGTDKFGSSDYEKEKPLIDEIIALYEQHYTEKDEAKRQAIYHKIDSVSLIASKYAIANEYDKMVSQMGAKGTNAYTWLDQTVYVNDIPSNQIEKWLTVEVERFRNPVMRLFHTELEAVYEEKNRTLDNDGRKSFYKMFQKLFPTHPYGTQSTIGTIEHLKNPSLVKVIDYFNTYYVPNNIALSLSGDLDLDQTIQWIDAKFGAWEAKELPKHTKVNEQPIAKSETVEVFGPDAESVSIGFRLPGAGSREADLLSMFDMVLSNSMAGLIDLNLNQKQKVIGASSSPLVFHEYSLLMLSGKPRQGQSLDEVKELLLSQIELIKKGEFEDWLPSAIVNDLRLNEIKRYESNHGRSDAHVNAFINHIKWEDAVTRLDRLEKITKQELRDFANTYFADNYVAVYKRTGEDKSIVKVEKPTITPVEVNRTSKSDFMVSIEKMNANEVSPVFIDYEKDIKKLPLQKGVDIHYTMNKENDLFYLYYLVDMGKNQDNRLGLALNYLKYLGTETYSPEEIKKEFYKVGCSFGVSSSDDQVYVYISGLKQNMDKGLALFENLLANAKGNDESLENLKKDVLKSRADAKLSKRTILWSALYNYGVYGKKSPFTNIIPEPELLKITSEELLALTKSITSYKHRVLYYGPNSPEELTASLNTYHKVPTALKDVPKGENFTELDTKNSKVFVVDYDMKQAEIVMLSKGEKFNSSNIAVRSLYNEYFGSGMGSIVFQTMRESKALAYSVYSVYRTPSKKEDSHYIFSYIGTQADKLPEAMKGMFELINELPQTEVAFEAAKNAIIKKIQTERITKTSILFSYENANDLGVSYDLRKDVYSQIPELSFEDVKSFQEKEIKDKNYTILVLGNRKTLDMKTLKKYGKVETLSLNDVFNY